ncbi:MAG: hypothetical protein ACLQNE_27910 [Thermoguttaceae bacterium]
MNRPTIRRLALTAGFLAAAAIADYRQSPAHVSAPECVSADKLQETDILPHTQGPITAGRNQVYCATFQLAWNDFQDNVLKGPIRLAGSPPMVKFLERDRELTTEILPPGCYLVKAGLVRDGVVDAIRKEMGERFPNATLRVPTDLGENAVAVAYAYLLKSLHFREAYDRLEKPLVFQSKSGPIEVACFGVRNLAKKSDRHRALAKQVRVLQYASDDDFILRLNTESAEDHIILAKTVPKETLAATLAAVQERVSKAADRREPRNLLIRESLVIPILNLNVVRRYAELEGPGLKNNVQGLGAVFLSVAEQGIRFRLDDKGARLESTARIEFKSRMPQRPREYVFDKPFLIYLQRTNAERPYLVMWVETPELMERVGK